MIRRSSNHLKFWLVLFPIIGTCALAQLPGSVQGGFFSQWYGIKSTPSWTPASLTNLLFWFTVTDESTITQVSGTNRVSEWRSKIGTNHLTQTVEADRPFYTTDSVTSQNVIRIVDDERMVLPFDQDGSNKFYAIVYRKPTTVNTIIFVQNQAGGTSFYDYLQYGNTWYVGDGTQTVNIDTNSFMLRAAYTGTSGVSVVRYSNAVAQAATTFNSSVKFGQLGHTIGSGNFNVREIVYVSGNLSTLDRQKLEGYLAHNSNIQDKLPSDHPYRNSPP